MKSPYLPAIVLSVISLCASVSAQRGGGGTGGGGTGGGATGGGGGHPGGTGTTIGNTPTTGFPNTNLPNVNPSSLVFFLSGKVTVDDGSALTDIATLQLECKGKRLTVGHTDTTGQFSFELGGEAQAQTYETPDATDTVGSGLPTDNNAKIAAFRAGSDRCFLLAI